MVPMHSLPCYIDNEYYFCPVDCVSKNDMIIQKVVRPEYMNPIGQDKETLRDLQSFAYLNVAVHAQVCRLFCVMYMYIPLFCLVQLGYPAKTNIFVVNQIIRY